MNSVKSPPAPRTPKKSLRKKRPLSTLYSPTLFTPDVKKNNRTSRKTNRKEWKAWTPAEKRFVIQYTDSKSIGNINWEECATLMERSLGTKRSAISCQTIFSRMEEDSYIEISVESKDISVQTDISLNPREKFAFAKMSEFEQQTEFVPYTSQTLHQLLSECDRTNMPEDPLPGKNFLSEDRNDVCMSNTEMLEHNYNQPLPTTFPHNDNNQQVPSDPLAHLSLSDHNYITNNSKLGKNKIRNSKVIPSQSAAEMISSLTVSQIARLKIILNSKRPKLIASTVLDMSPLKQNIVQIIANKSSKVADSMKNRIHNTSVLMPKDPNSLKSLEIKDIVEEFEQKLPELYKIVYSMMCPYESVTKEQIIPRLATVYSVIMFTRNMELSRLQRVVGCCLLNSICDQKVILKSFCDCVEQNLCMFFFSYLCF